EQAAAQPLEPASDWYAVGVMIYEALTGKLPFRGNVIEILLEKQKREPPAPRQLDPKLPRDLDELCVALLRRVPRDRPSREEILRRIGGISSSVGMPTISTPEVARGPFTGRARQLAALGDAFAQMCASRTALTVFVHGRSGMGKSLLVRQFLDSVRDRAVVLAG